MMHLDEAISGIANRDEITVTQLLTHSSGLVREGNFGYWFNTNFPDRDQLSQFLDSTTLRTSPGSEVRYSNIGFAALGLAVESGPRDRVSPRRLSSTCSTPWT